jgi:hypothetical protein
VYVQLKGQEPERHNKTQEVPIKRQVKKQNDRTKLFYSCAEYRFQCSHFNNEEPHLFSLTQIRMFCLITTPYILLWYEDKCGRNGSTLVSNIAIRLDLLVTTV